MSRNNLTYWVRLLTASALLAALIAVGIVIFRIPVGSNGGYIHFGDSMIYIAACILPAPYALAAASIGGGLADLLAGAPMWILPTMVIKPLTALWFTNKGKFLNSRNIAALFLAGVTSIIGYYLAEVYFYASWSAPLAFQWGGAIQSGGSAFLFALIAAVFDRANFKSRLRLPSRTSRKEE